MAKKKTKKTIIFLVKISVAVALIAWLYQKGDIDPQQFSNLKDNWHFLPLILLLLLPVPLAGAMRWRMLLKAQDIHISAMKAFRLTYIGVFFNMFLPGAVSGDVIRAYYIAKDGKKRAEAVTTVFLDRIVGLVALMLLALIAVLINISTIMAHADLRQLALALILILGGIGLGTAVLMSSKVRYSTRLRNFFGRFHFKETLKKIYDAARIYREHKLVVVKALLISFAAHSAMIMALYYASRCLWQEGDSLPAMLQYFFLAPLGFFINAVPISPGGAGVGEAALDWLFAFIGYQGGANSMLLLRFMLIVMSLGGLYFYLASGKEYADAAREAQEDAASRENGDGA